MQKVKLKDIAKEVGLSVPTVSRALGGFDDIAEETRILVRNKAREIGYRPNIHARNLVAKKASIENIIILGVPNVLKSISLNSYYAEILRAFCDILNTSQYRLVLAAEDDYENDYVDYHKIINDHSAVGAIILHLKENDERTSLLERSKVPFVVLGEYEPSSDLQYAIWTDNVKGAYIAVAHLIRKGRKKIAMIGGLPGQMVSKSRCQGYKQALNEANIEYDSNLIIEPEELDEQGGYTAMLDLLNRKVEFDAVFCASDLRSIGVIKALRENGLYVPNDISVVGYDDLTIASFIEPPLTTVRQPTYKVGIQAIKILEKLINKEKLSNKKKVFIPELIIRVSA